VFDYVDPVIVALKSQLPPVVLTAEARGEPGRAALATLTKEELLQTLSVSRRLIVRHEQRLADLEAELAARQGG
jgi:hypothetical protein